MKRALAILVCFAMLFALIGCAAETLQADQPQPVVETPGPTQTKEPSKAKFAAGTYTATAKGFGGPIIGRIAAPTQQARRMLPWPPLHNQNNATNPRPNRRGSCITPPSPGSPNINRRHKVPRLAVEVFEDGTSIIL